MNVKPIKTDADHSATLQKIERLWGAEIGTTDGDHLDVLITLVESYEREHFPMDVPDPIEAIKFRLEQQGMDYRSLVGVIGQRTRVYEVMRRDRPLSLAMIRRLHETLHIPAESLILPVKMRRRKRLAARPVNTRRKSA